MVTWANAYEVESARLYAGEAAVKIVQSIALVKPYKQLKYDITQLKYLKARDGYAPSMGAILDEASKRNIPFHRLSDESLIMLGQGCTQKMLSATVTSDTSIIRVDEVIAMRMC